MADQHDSSGSSGEQLIAEIGAPASPRASCIFHAYTGDGPCPYCIEAGTAVEGVIYRDFKPVGKPWIDSCPHCASTDIRRCVAIMQDFAWCGACGKRDGQ